MINLRRTLEVAKKCLEESGIDFALIGGFALGAHGIHRATKDIDIIISNENRQKAIEELTKSGFRLDYESKDILQWSGEGYLDVLLAQRPLSLEMLELAKVSELFGVKVIAPEGIIGLKIQAYKNDDERRLQDLADIQSLLKLQGIDLEKVRQYAELFDEWKKISELIR